MTATHRGFSSLFRLGLVCLVVLAAFGCIGARLVYLHVIKAGELLAEVDRARKRVDILHARRGEIRDSNGNVLALSRSSYSVGVDPQVAVDEDASKLPRLAALLDRPLAEIQEAFARKSAPDGEGGVRQIRWTELADEVDDDVYQRITELGIKGVYGNRHYRRAYPLGTLAAHVIGYVNREGTAVMGVERYLDYYLQGQDGWRESERDGLRRELAQFTAREIPPTNGFNVVLSIDSVVQTYIEEELRAIVNRFHPAGATIIVSDPRDGFIFGLANYPTFNLEQYNKADFASQRNRAITDIFEPGSTFKIVPAAAALNEGLVTPETRFDCSLETVAYHGRELSLPHDSHLHGVLTVADIVSKSSNRGAAHLGILLGADRLYRYAAAFGFGQPTGFALEGEVSGILHPVDDWDGLTITRLPMGHAVGVTALQIHYAMAAIANHGILMRPQVVRRIVDEDGATVIEFAPIERRRVVQPKIAELVSRLLVRVVSDEGTAERAAIPGFEVAGKTGTTQKIIDGHYSSTHHVGSFVGYFPASKPRLVISVIVDDAHLNGIAYGSTVAAPSFKSIAEKLIQHFGISPTQPGKAGPMLAGEIRAASFPRDRLR